MKKISKIVSAFVCLAMAVGVGVAIGSTGRDAERVSAADTELSFDVSSNPGEWPTASNAGNYVYTLGDVDYTFALGANVYCNSGYLMLKSTTSLGLPALSGKKLTKIVAHNSSGCSTSTRVGVSSSSSSASYISGGAYQTWGTTSSTYTYNLSSTAANTMYYLYITNKNCQITQLDLTYASEGSSDYVGSLSVSPATWTGYDSQTLSVSSFTVSGSKNGTAGAVTSSDYEYKGIGYMSSGNFVARDASFSSGRPTTADTRLAWKAKYPTTSGGSTYAWAYVTLSVTADTVSSVAISGDLSTSFNDGQESWSFAGLTATATYASSTSSDVTEDTTFAVYEESAMTSVIASPKALGKGNHTIYIKATFSGISNATGYEQSITISPAPKKVTWDLSVDSTSEASATKLAWTNSYADMACNKGSASTATNNYYPGTEGKSYTSTRFYTNSILSITPKSGVTISKVEFTATSASYATALKNSTWTNASSSVSDTLVTITPTDGTTVFSATIGGTCGFTAVDVYYTAKELTEITWAGTAVSPQYVGDAFNYSGLTFTAHFSDSTTETIPGSSFAWSPLQAGKNPVGTYMGQGVSISGVSVINNILESIAISGDMTKKQYKAGGTWDPSGLVVTATFSKGPQVVTDDVEWEYSPAAPAADTKSVVVTASYTSGGVTKTDSTDPISITIQEIEGLLSSGYYYITATNESTYYFPQGEYTAGGAANNPAATAYNSDVYGVPYYFNLIEDNTYTISFVNGSDKNCYLNVNNDNSGAKVTELDSITNACKWTLSTNGTGHYKLVANDGTQDRYLALYDQQDWRTYKTTSTSGVNVLDIVAENDKFANDFKNSYTSGCNASGSYTSLEWTKAKSHFNALHDSSEFVDAEYTVSGTGAQTVVTKSGDTRQLVAEAVAKYDYIVTKYNTTTSVTFEEFMHRIEANKISYNSTLSIAGMFGLDSTTSVTIIVIISIISVTSIGALLVLRRRKEN